ncbi:hypothetical protein NC653_002741 [Populus alba x Populus x berolinensis]|uniref:Uncharacterized protein n=1 Tax=Populus alba x Populus x berolinensis TaxID=444605 RepID=A0AAD6WI85_9ROSI|nr:hypothetical protein NC653_002741 [Populus alba x Populus x berolinensis]
MLYDSDDKPLSHSKREGKRDPYKVGEREGNYIANLLNKTGKDGGDHRNSDKDGIWGPICLQASGKHGN